MVFWTRLLSIRHMAMRIATEQRERLFQEGSDAPHPQRHAWQQTLQAWRSVGAVTGARCGREISVLRRALAHQRGQIVGQHLGVYVYQQRVLRQPRNTLQLAAMFEPLEGLFNAPALMVKLSKQRCGEITGRQVGRQYPRLPIGRDALNQPDLWRGSRAQIVSAILSVGFVESHDCIHLDAARKGAHRSPASAGLLAAYTKSDVLLGQVRHQPGRRVAPIEQQHIVWPQARERLKQHLPLSTIGAMHTGVKGEFSARQIQGKQALIGAGQASGGVTRPNRRHQHRCIGRHQTQTMPAWHQTQCIGSFHNKGVQALKACPGQLVSGLGKTAIRNTTLPVTVLGQAAKEGVEHDLL